MDQDRFDQFARALGAGATRRAGLRAALGGLLGLAAAAGTAAPDADARRNGRRRNEGADARADRRKRPRKRCSPPCAAGQTCVKGQCRCDDGGTACGAACCLIGQACQGGQCVTLPEPGQCVAAGEPCKNVGVPCCEGRVCASGQGGMPDVACYVPKTGVCASTADCVYGMICQDGRCAPPAPAPLGASCDLAAQQLCATPGAVCTGYTAPDAPGGAHCTLPLRKVCTGDPDCTCYHCDFVDDLAEPAGRDGRTSSNTKACCLPAERACAADQDCCRGLSCTGGVCGGPSCIAIGGTGCAADGDCCDGSYCEGGTCLAYPAICDVCPAGGGCPYTSIKDAYDALPSGSTMFIAPAVYDEAEILLPASGAKSMTFRACRGLDPANPVVWRNASYQGTLIGVPSPGSQATFGFRNLTLTQKPGQGLIFGLLFLYGGQNSTQRVTVSMDGCTVKDCSSGFPALTFGRYTDATVTGCTFTNLSATNSSACGGAMYLQNSGQYQGTNTVTLLRSTFSGNSNTSNDTCGGGAIAILGTNTRIEGCTFTDNWSRMGGALSIGMMPTGYKASAVELIDSTLTDNVLRAITNQLYFGYAGGAIRIGPDDTLAISGTTSITQNHSRDANDTADSFRGSAIVVTLGTTAASTRITGVTASNVTDNTPAPQCGLINAGNPAALTPLDCVTWT